MDIKFYESSFLENTLRANIDLEEAVKNLRFDCNNPRVKDYIFNNKIIQDKVSILHESKSFTVLLDSIKRDGILDPLITTYDGEVINGNRRLLALNKIYQDNISDTLYLKQFLVPLIYIKRETVVESGREKVIHLISKEMGCNLKWNQYHIAYYIKKSLDYSKETYETLSKGLNMSKSTIRNLLIVFDTIQTYSAHTNDNNAIDMWDYFDTINRNKFLSCELRRNSNNKDIIFSFVKKLYYGSNSIKEDIDAIKRITCMKDIEKITCSRRISSIKRKHQHSYSIGDELNKSLDHCIKVVNELKYEEIDDLKQIIEIGETNSTLELIKELSSKLNNLKEFIFAKK
jgi:hypothetical protein